MTPSALVVDEWHSDTTPLKLHPINSPSEASSSATIIGRRPSVGSGSSAAKTPPASTIAEKYCRRPGHARPGTPSTPQKWFTKKSPTKRLSRTAITVLSVSRKVERAAIGSSFSAPYSISTRSRMRMRRRMRHRRKAAQHVSGSRDRRW